MDILNSITLKKNIIDKNVYQDIENYINYTNSGGDFKQSVVFHEEKYNSIIGFNNGISFDSVYPYISIYSISQYQVLFNLETDEYILFFGDSITPEKIKNVKSYNITKNWDIMKQLCVNFIEDMFININENKRQKTN